MRLITMIFLWTSGCLLGCEFAVDGAGSDGGVEAPVGAGADAVPAEGGPVDADVFNDAQAGPEMLPATADLIALAADLISPGADLIGPTPDMTAPKCGGYVHPQLGGCWYVGDGGGWTCNKTCKSRGGFDRVATQHTGIDVLPHFFPKATFGTASISPLEVLFANRIYPASGSALTGNEWVDGGAPACSCFF